MADYAKVINNFSAKGKALNFILTFTSDVIGSLERNTAFPGAGQYLAPVKEKYDKLSEQAMVAKTGSLAQKRNATQTKWELQSLLKPLANYVNGTANGNRAVLLTTAFKLNKETKTARVLVPVEEFKVVNGIIAGDIVMSYKGQYPGITAMFRWTADKAITPATVWEEKSATTVTCKFSGLPQGELISFQVVLMGSNEQMIVSGIVTKKISFGL